MIPTDDAPNLRDIHVLVLDDHQDTLDVFSAALRACGANVFTARTARDTVTVIKTVRLVAIVSDLTLPDEDGLWVVNQLRRLSLTKGGSIPALAVTAHWDKYTSKDATDAGFDVFLTKPVDPLDLCRTVGVVGRPLMPGSCREVMPALTIA